MNEWQPKMIVVGADGSEGSVHAAAAAAALARQVEGAELRIVTVVRPPEGWWGIVGSPPPPSAMTDALSKAQRQVLDRIEGDVDLTDVTYEMVEEIGEPARALAAYCDSVGADVLVVGRRGGGFLGHLVMGSVADRLAHTAPCPVLVVP